jgi:hypothetical protein
LPWRYWWKRKSEEGVIVISAGSRDAEEPAWKHLGSLKVKRSSILFLAFAVGGCKFLVIQ